MGVRVLAHHIFLPCPLIQIFEFHQFRFDWYTHVFEIRSYFISIISLSYFLLKRPVSEVLGFYTSRLSTALDCFICSSIHAMLLADNQYPFIFSSRPNFVILDVTATTTKRQKNLVILHNGSVYDHKAFLQTRNDRSRIRNHLSRTRNGRSRTSYSHSH